MKTGIPDFEWGSRSIAPRMKETVMGFRNVAVGAGVALALSLGGTARAALVTLSLGPSTEIFTQYGQGADNTGRGTFREGQGSSTFNGVTSTFMLSGLITSGNTPGLDTGSYRFVTTYAGPNAPEAGPNAPRGRTNAMNPLVFNYSFLDPSTRMDLYLSTPTGNFVHRLFDGTSFNGGFNFTITSATCTGLMSPCSQNTVGLTPGSTISGPVRIGVNFDSTTLTPVPEPGSWALMIVGFGAMGGLLRSRRQSAMI
jgi:hypothetical protein